MDNKKLADLLFPSDLGLKSVDYYEEKYKPRNLKEGSVVTRFAPSPTGFLHFGGLFTSYVANRVAKQSGGKYILRIEDTDQERKVEGGVEYLINGLKEFDITFDEREGKGEYGPYTQSERKNIYMAYAKHLVELGNGYPCFCSKEQLEADKNTQEVNKELVGYYGHYARCRDLSIEEVEENLKANKSFVIRLKSRGSIETVLRIKDAVRGDIMPIARRYNINQVLRACDYYFEKTGRRVTIEYILIKDLTATEDQLKQLIKLFQGTPYHINLIKMNPVEERGLMPITRDESVAFKEKLEEAGLSVTLRRTLGDDIDSACGQLRQKHLKNEE